MKRLTVLFLVFILISTLALGCSKDKEDDVLNEDTSANTEDNNDNEEENENTEEVNDIDYVIYVKHKSVPFISGEKFSIPENDIKLDENTIERVALEHLIQFGKMENYETPIPEGTKIIDIAKEGSTVHVNLSKEFVENMDKNKTDTGIAIASIVNTLTTFEGNEKVVIVIEGEQLEEINGVRLDKEFEFIEDYFPTK